MMAHRIVMELTVVALAATALVACGDDDDEAAGSSGGGAGGTSSGMGPQAELAISPDTITESPPSTVTFTVSLSEDPGADGTRVYVLGDEAQSLTQLDLTDLEVVPDGNAAPQGDLDFSGFTLLMTTREVSVTIGSFDDMMDEAPSSVRYTIVPFEEVPWGELAVENVVAAGPYRVATATATAELAFRDAPP
ncbi:MAG: hypothetical protein AAGN82_20430 [Myxococcota bacterium]